jgi:hypothetical protein
MMQLARTTQSMYYPEIFTWIAVVHEGFLGLGEKGKAPNTSESFGTLRYGNLAEILSVRTFEERRPQSWTQCSLFRSPN